MVRRFSVWWLITLVFVSGARGHDPMSGWATLRLEAERMTLESEMAVEAAMAVTGVPMGSAPGPANPRTLLPQLDQRVAAGGLYRLSLEGSSVPLVLTSALVEMREEDGIGFVLTYARPQSMKGLTVDAPFLTDMPAQKRSAFTVLSADGRVLTSVVLRPGKSSAELSWPGAGETTVEAPATAAANVASDPVSEPAKGSGWSVFKTYLGLGVEHILIGYDHLLFLLGLMVACRRIQSMLLIVTCFTVGHTVTLGLAALDVISLPSRVIEPLIAASIVYVGVENLWRREEPKARWMVTLIFGLVHGFGFAGVLREIGFGAAGSSVAVPLLAFNLGVELGQLAVVAVALPLLFALRRRPALARVEVPVASACVVVLGLYWLVERLGGA